MDALTDELVELITNYSPARDRSRFSACKTAATKNLRYHQFPRTNQFEVRNSLEGLIEKFQVLNNDALASELEHRLDELKPRASRWTPELLSLLLLLSDDPLNKTNLDRIKQLQQPNPEPSLQWADLLADDPAVEDGLWDDVDFRADSEDEDTTLQSVLSSRISGETRRSSITDDGVQDAAGAFVLPVQKAALESISPSHDKVKQGMTEMRIMRETLHMLLGLPTTLYERHRSSSGWVQRPDVALDGLSRTSLHDLLGSCASMGSDLATSRAFCATKSTIPLLQTYSSCMQDTLHMVDTAIAHEEAELVGLKATKVISLIELEAKVRELHKHITDLKDNIPLIRSLPSDQAYLLLDQLFYQVSLAQTVGDDAAFAELGQVFCHCLQTYLKPLKVWLEEGILDSSTLALPFVSRQEVGISSFWQDRYALALDRSGKLKTPQFMQDMMPHIFSSGKGVAFMRELGLSPKPVQISAQDLSGMGQLNFTSICGLNNDSGLLPFSDLLATALRNWVSSRAHATWLELRQQLFSHGGVLDTVRSFEYLYLCRDGSVTDSFTHNIFTKLDAQRRTWQDSFVLQDTARECFSTTEAVDVGKITRTRPLPYTSTTSRRERTVKSLDVIFSSISYTYAPYIHNIVPPDTALPIYQAAATLLVQLSRPLYLLTQPRLIIVGAVAVPQPALRLRYILMHTLTAVRSHLLNTSISLPSRTLEDALAAAESIDGLIAAHSRYMSSLERGCLLVKAVEGVKSAMLSLADLGVLFTELWDRYLQGTTSVSARSGPGLDKDSEDESDNEDERPREGVKDEDEIATARAPLSRAEFEKRVKQMQIQHDQLVGFIVAGLRTAARSQNGEPSWNVLAEVLTWSMKGSEDR